MLQNILNIPTQLYLINIIFKLESKELKRISLLKWYHHVILLKSGHWVVLLKVTRRRRFVPGKVHTAKGSLYKIYLMKLGRALVLNFITMYTCLCHCVHLCRLSAGSAD